jgi:hypothetical protein
MLVDVAGQQNDRTSGGFFTSSIKSDIHWVSKKSENAKPDNVALIFVSFVSETGSIDEETRSLTTGLRDDWYRI